VPLLFFDVPRLWSPSTPPLRFKVDGFFVAKKNIKNNKLNTRKPPDEAITATA
jgi:hypothetical protein